MTNGQSASATAADQHTEVAFHSSWVRVACGPSAVNPVGTFATGQFKQLRLVARSYSGSTESSLTLSLVEGSDTWDFGKLVVPASASGTNWTLVVDVPGKTFKISAACAGGATNFVDVLAYGN